MEYGNAVIVFVVVFVVLAVLGLAFAGLYWERDIARPLTSDGRGG